MSEKRETKLRLATQKQLAEWAGYSDHRLREIDKKLPEDQKLFVATEADSSRYDIAIFIQRWVQYNVSKAVDSESMDFGTVKTEHEKVKKHKTELQVQVMEGELIPVRDVRRLWGDIIDNARKALLQVSNQVAPRLMMVDNVERIASIIDERIREELGHIADTPLPAYVEDGDDE